MQKVKQVIVIRKDVKMKRSRLIALASQVASRFLIDNNESSRGDELVVKLSKEEAEWINGSSPPIILSVSSHDALNDLVFKAELLDVNVHTVSSQSTKSEGDPSLLCAAFGPDEEEIINKITGNLKPV